jgi:hypothetical protein
MALIKEGSINNFSVIAKDQVMKKNPFLKGVRTFSALKEVSQEFTPDLFELVTSTDQRGIAIKSIKLTEGFEGFLQKYLNPTNEIYFVAWVWDLSGQPVNLYPGPNFNSQDVIIPMKVDNIREFIGQGINLFPKRYIKGGIAIRIQLWESDQNVRNFGKAMTETADAIKKSDLNNLLTFISSATGVSGVTLNLIKEASIELAKVIGNILQSNGDDYVDFFEGYYASDQTWTNKDETYHGNSSILTINKY